MRCSKKIPGAKAEHWNIVEHGKSRGGTGICRGVSGIVLPIFFTTSQQKNHTKIMACTLDAMFFPLTIDSKTRIKKSPYSCKW